MQRKATKNTRGPNTVEKKYQRWIKESNYCCCCESESVVICHHAMGSTYKHNKILVGHIFCIGLCEDCDSVITRFSRRSFTDRFGPQGLMWAKSFSAYLEFSKSNKSDFKREFDAIMDCRA